MRHLIIIALFLISFVSIKAQTAHAIMDKSIAYHDPSQYWGKFQGKLMIDLLMPDSTKRYSQISIDLPNEVFEMEERKGEDVIHRKIDASGCILKLNGKPNFSEDQAQTHRLTCERAEMYKNYYTFLYGLPMKLKDAGATLHDDFESVVFKTKEYYKLKITFDEKVGKDTWYLYINPVNYAMEIYQFYHDEAKNDGEYILLNGEIEYQNMRIPKVRKWYTNKEDKYLGTDDLKVIQPLKM
jgi:hypothetical protein